MVRRALSWFFDLAWTEEGRFHSLYLSTRLGALWLEKRDTALPFSGETSERTGEVLVWWRRFHLILTPSEAQ